MIAAIVAAVRMHDRPMAARGLHSYRYLGRYGWVMIGAKDDADALREAARSISGPVDANLLQRFDGIRYIHV